MVITMRKHYIDNIKWITVVLVVIFHMFYMFNANGVAGGPGPFYENQPWDVYQYIVYPWFMCLLFVVSGMNSRFYLNSHSNKEFLRSRTRKLLVPSTIGLFVFQWIQGYVNVMISGALNATAESVPAGTPQAVIILINYFIMVLSGTGVLWYMQMLWVYSLVLLLIKALEKDRLYNLCGKLPIYILPLLALLLWGGAQILNVPMIACYKFGVYGTAFFLGYFVFSHDQNVEKAAKLTPVMIVLTVLSGTAFVMAAYDTNYAITPVFNSPLSMLYAWSAILAILGGMKKWCDFTNPFLTWMSRKSFGLYVFHYLGISTCAYYLYTYTELPPLLIYPLVLAAGFITGYGLYEIISRIPVLRWCVLGIKTQNNL